VLLKVLSAGIVCEVIDPFELEYKKLKQPADDPLAVGN